MNSIALKYNLRSLLVRRGTTLMTIASIAFVVLVFVGVFAVASGIQQAFRVSGDPQTLIVLRGGARTETESLMTLDSHRVLATLPGVDRTPEGEILASPEMMALQVKRREDGSQANVTLRGVEPVAFDIRRGEIRVVEGRLFEPGKAELVVGRALAERFPELRLGRETTFGRLQFHIVGVLDDGGGTASSELWAPLGVVRDAYRRDNLLSSTRLKATSPEEALALMKRIEEDQRLAVNAMLERKYYEESSRQLSSQFELLGQALAVLMGFGACFAAANTMYAHVSSRGREIATLRVLGFSRGHILTAFLLEAGVLGLLAGLVGVVLALPLNAVSAGTFNFATFAEISFQLHTAGWVLAGGVLLAVVTCLLGGLPPAWRASRQRIASLLREA